MRHYDYVARRASGWALWAFLAMIVGLYLFGCSFPFLQVVNPTYTVQMQTSQGLVDVQIPKELPDFVTGKRGIAFPVAGNICVLMFSGVTENLHQRIIDRYEFIVECNVAEILALRATTMDTERFWIYIKGIPIPASHDQVKEKIEGLIGKKI